jgi:organic hydroperoxide reductase OsmC/OhrA
MSEPVSEFVVRLEQVRDYEFRVNFGKPELAELIVDEPPPLGHDAGPNPSRLLAAAVVNCLAASFLFCNRRARVETGPVTAEVKVQMVRNQDKRLRIGSMEVVIDPHLPEGEIEKARRCREIFEDFCVVTQSVRNGLDVSVRVKGFD